MKMLNGIFLKPHLYIIIVLIGISLKIYKLDQQFFWDDEIATILHTSGIPMGTYEEEIPVNEIFNRSYFDDLLRLNDRDLSLKDQIVGLSKMPQVTPGHYYYFIFLNRIFGDDYMVYRLFSLVIFLLSIPFLYLLTSKIFNSKLAGLLAISLYSVSPFFQVYAQESRYYVLWAFAIVLMHYLFMLAIEKRKISYWSVYVFFGFFAVHVTILFYITLLAHFIYLLIFYRHQWKSLVLSQLAIFLTSLPWLIFIYINREDIQQGLSWQQAFGALTLFELIIIHINNFIEVFIYSFKIGLQGSFIGLVNWVYGILLFVALYIFFAKASSKQRWFVALITFLGVIFLISLDLLRSSISSELSRYLLLNFIGMLILVSYALEWGIRKIPFLTGGIFISVVALGISSSIALANDTAFGKRADAYYHVEDSKELFSGEEHILIISDFSIVVPKSYSGFMSLINASKNPNIDIMYVKKDYPDFKKDIDYTVYDKVYAMYLSTDLKSFMDQRFNKEEFKEIKHRITYGQFDNSVYTIQLLAEEGQFTEE